MEFRSTNDVGYSHYQGDIITNVSSGYAQNSSHGVQLTGGSTGGIVTAAGDEANIALRVRAKGAGPLILGGASSGAVQVPGSSGSTLSLGGGSTGQITLGSTNSTVFIAGSTAPFSGFLRFEDTAVSTPALFNDTEARVTETTHAIAALSSVTAGVPPPYYIYATCQNLPSLAISLGAAFVGSTAGDVHVRLSKGSSVAVAATTCTFEFLVVRM